MATKSSIKLTKIYLTDLQRWDGDRWVGLVAAPSGQAQGSSPESLGPESDNKVVLFPHITQMQMGGPGLPDEHDPAQEFQQTIDWGNLKVQIADGAPSLGWTIFGIDPLLVGNDAPSVKIRYKLEVHDNASPPNVYSPNTLYYQIIKASHPADHIMYIGMVPSGVFTPVALVRLPGITNTMVANSASLFSWMKNTANWRMRWTKPGGHTRVYSPDLVTVGEPYKDEENPEYGGSAVDTTLRFPQINIAHSGNHKLEIQFLPNDQQTGGFHLFDDDETWVAVVTAYTPSMEDPLQLSFEKTIFLKISFAESNE